MLLDEMKDFARLYVGGHLFELREGQVARDGLAVHQYNPWLPFHIDPNRSRYQVNEGVEEVL